MGSLFGRRIGLLCLALLSLVAPWPVESFFLSSKPRVSRTSIRPRFWVDRLRYCPFHIARLSSNDENNDPSDSTSSLWVLPNSFELFLNQCAIQSFVFLLKSLRDPQTVLWIENFTQPSIELKERPQYEVPDDVPDFGSATSKLLSYHGLAAMNTTLFPTWESYFEQLLEQPDEIFTIESSVAHIPDYDLEINPASLSSRLLSVRAQISQEFVRDLDVIAAMGGHSLDSYWQALQQQRESNATGQVKLQRENLLFLEFSANEDDDYAPSPLRKGNFDLLVLLATQESIHRVLNNPERTSDAERSTNQFLQTFYANRLLSHFTGAQRYGRGDQFLEELLMTPPRMVLVRSGVTSLIDPIRVAELVLQQRELVALEWKELARNAPVEHTAIQRLQLNRLMGISSNQVEEEESKESE